MVSFDVVSLFTSIPIELALQVVKQRLVQVNNLTTRTDISINNIIKLLELVLRNSFFKYDGCHCRQISVCAMGSPISATLANIIMENIEEIAITTAPHPPRWWFRFVDDSYTCLLKDYVSEFHDHLNSINPNIQFTVEKETESKLAFLDTMTTRDNTNPIEVSVYRKPTHTNKYLDFNSHHPTTHKRSVVNSLLNRADIIPTSTSGKRKERKHVFNVLMDNGYPKQFFKTV
jgi:hypothetical protein